MGEKAEEELEKVKDTVASIATPIISLGAFEFDRDSDGVHRSALTRELDEATGEITGRNAQREALQKQEARINQEGALRDQEIADERERARRLDIQASQAAQAFRGTNTTKASGRSTSISSLNTKLGDEGDFLGL